MLTVNWLSVKVTLDHGGRTHLIRSLKLERKLKLPGEEILYEAVFPPACCCPQPVAGLPDRWQMHWACSCAPRLPVHGVDAINALERSQTDESDRVSPGADLSPAYLPPSLWETAPIGIASVSSNCLTAAGTGPVGDLRLLG